MKAIVIGAGRGARLMPLTEEDPKCFAPIRGKRIIDWGVNAIEAAGFNEVVFIGGYRIESVQRDYPDFTFCHNVDWKNNNILVSLMHAEFHMDEGFVCMYSDILYRTETLQELSESPHDITIVCDTEWRERYEQRTDHPESDAEKVAAVADRVIAVNRTMPSEATRGEYIGVARFTAEGAASLRQAYHESREKCDGRSFQAASSFEKAYLIDLYQEMLDDQIPIHMLETMGGYMEVDTTQDYEIAEREWR